MFRFPIKSWLKTSFSALQGDYWGDHDWYRGDDQDAAAMVAYESMLRIALHQPNSTHYQDFEESVKQRAFDHYNFSYGEEKVRPTAVGNLHDGNWIEFPLTKK